MRHTSRTFGPDTHRNIHQHNRLNCHNLAKRSLECFSSNNGIVGICICIWIELYVIIHCQDIMLSQLLIRMMTLQEMQGLAQMSQGCLNILLPHEIRVTFDSTQSSHV